LVCSLKVNLHPLAVGKELNFGKAEFCAKSGAYSMYVSIFKQNYNVAKIVIIFQP